ncbi:MAG: adenylate/guanylate cyclase domain-containing protein [Methylophilaceae bacterium]
MNERLNKTSICSVVFLDIIDYSKNPVSEQIDDKTYFNAIINEAIKDIAQNDRIILDTGDGAAIALQGAPEEALFVALTIRDGLLGYHKEKGQHLHVRIGINLGPVRVVSDINGRPNIIGDGINVAQRVMSFAEPDQILVSRSYYEVTSRLTNEISGMFSYFGVRQDKHVREHEVYVIRSPGTESPASVQDTVANLDALEQVETVGASTPSSIDKYKLGLLAGALSLALAFIAFLLLHKAHMPDIAIKFTTPAVAAPLAAEIAGPAHAVGTATASSPSSLPSVQQISASSSNPENSIAEASKTKLVKHTKPSSNQTSHKNSEAKKKGGADLATIAAAKNAEPVHKNAYPEGNANQSARSDKAHAESSPNTGWETFKHSIQQGSETKSCTPAERALNQCQ